VEMADLEDETPGATDILREGNHIVPKLTLERLLLNTQ